MATVLTAQRGQPTASSEAQLSHPNATWDTLVLFQRSHIHLHSKLNQACCFYLPNLATATSKDKHAVWTTDLTQSATLVQHAGRKHAEAQVSTQMLYTKMKPASLELSGKTSAVRDSERSN